MFRIAQAGGIGVNFHGGGSGWYTPIAGTRAKGFEARPLYYGMRLFREAAPGGELLDTNLSTVPDGLRVYAVQRAAGRVTLIALNLSLEHPIDLALDHSFNGKPLLRLQAPTPPQNQARPSATPPSEQTASGTQARTKPQPIISACRQPAPY